MSDLLRTIAAYVPPSIAHAALTADSPSPPTTVQQSRFEAAVLFADISGFTPLTEALGQRGSEGPEELTRLLNRYFGWMIAFVEVEGGEVVKFGGDALTVVFPAQDQPLGVAVRRAVQAANTMQSTMDEFGIMESSVGLVTLKMKIGIGAGSLLSAHVGGIAERWEYIISGDALFQALKAERSAKQDEICLSPQAQALVVPQSLPPSLLPSVDWKEIANPNQVQAVLRCYIPKSVLAWLDEELHGWLATLRPMSVLFIGIKGLDYDQPNTVERLHAFVIESQEIVYQYQGSLPRVTIDDKGTTLLVLFGAPPYSHEDDPERAVRCALNLQRLARQQNLQLSIGVTTGRVFAGPVGGYTRREYTVMGDTVNLAARLMSNTRPGQICCNYETYRSTYSQLNYEPLAPIRVKGKSEEVRAYRPTGERDLGQQIEQIAETKAHLPLVGREQELSQVLVHLDAVEAGRGRVLIIEGEAGIGKSQVVKHLVRRVKRRQTSLLLGLGRSIEQTTPYRAWRDIFATYLKRYDGSSTTVSPRLAARLEQLDPAITNALPQLINLLASNFSSGSKPNGPVPTVPHQTLNPLLLTLLQLQAAVEPLVVILEDAQWLDNFSWELAMQIAQTIATQNPSLLLVLAMRPLEDNSRRLEINQLLEMSTADGLRLETIPSDKILTLVAAPIGLTSNELPEMVAELIRNRAGGNPFFAEELFYALHQNSFITFKTMQDKVRCLVIGDLSRAGQTLPATIQSTILAQIDQLSPEKQLILKIAAVLGQQFTYTPLRDTLRENLDIDEKRLKIYLDDLTYLGLIYRLESQAAPVYAFKHSIIREVTYQSTLFDRRRQLHRSVARWYEETYDYYKQNKKFDPGMQSNHKLLGTRTLPPASTPLAPFYALLVYHWHQAEDERKEQYYAARIAEQAVAQFANAEAIGYLNRAIDLTPEDDMKARYKLFLARETVFDRRGDRERQILDLEHLHELAVQMEEPAAKATAALRYADYAYNTGKYPKAIQAAETAIVQAKHAADPTNESQGLVTWANAKAAQGHCQIARKKLDRARTLAQIHRVYRMEAKILLSMAHTQMMQGNYAKAETLCQQALSQCQLYRAPLTEADALSLMGQVLVKLGQAQTAAEYLEQAVPTYYITGHQSREAAPLAYIGLIQLQQGYFEAARDYFEQSVDIARDASDKRQTADGLAMLGGLYCNLGDYTVAQGYLGQALGIQKEIGNQQGEARLLSLFGNIYHKLGDPKTTRRYCKLALKIQQIEGFESDESLTQTYLGHALVSLNELSAAAAAYQRALGLLRQTGQNAATIAPMTGLANVCRIQSNLDEATAMVGEILDWLGSIGSFGIEEPFWVYLKLYQTLELTAGQQAQETLAAAHEMLQTYANRFTSSRLKQMFLHNVAANKQILRLWSEYARQTHLSSVSPPA